MTTKTQKYLWAVLLVLPVAMSSANARAQSAVAAGNFWCSVQTTAPPVGDNIPEARVNLQFGAPFGMVGGEISTGYVDIGKGASLDYKCRAIALADAHRLIFYLA